MIRRVIQIDEEKCIGCGLCANACHEGAIGIVNGKAKLLRDDYCDGFGDCLPSCPANAISFIEREALAYDEQAVLEHKNKVLKPVEDIKLNNWPIQIKLAPLSAPYLKGAKLLVAADCTAYAYSGFHSEFIKDHVLLVGCTKLDNTDYSQKLKDIIELNGIKDILVVKMEVPCCRGMEMAVNKAIEGLEGIAIEVKTISRDGRIL